MMKKRDYKKWTDVTDPDEDDVIEGMDPVVTLSKKIQPLQSIHNMIRDSQIVLIGESTHGTKEFYEFRCELTKTLIENGTIKGICIEGDWPDVSLMHMWVTNMSPNLTLDDIMDSAFCRFPRWMWCNTTIYDFLTWLREWNDSRPPEDRCGIFGIDLYSLRSSMAAVIDYLQKTDPDTAKIVKKYYSCFDEFGGDGERYGAFHAQAHRLDHPKCKEAFENSLQRIIAIGSTHANPTNDVHIQDMNFINQINALVVTSAEHYYRSIFNPHESSWEVRDTHFFKAFESVREHLLTTRGCSGVAVWAHNSHLGDARHTQKGARYKELNIGQLVKERYETQCISVGQLTYDGNVFAAKSWGKDGMEFKVKKAYPSSWEGLFHYISKLSGSDYFALDMREQEFKEQLEKDVGLRMERAIGVIYCPNTELQSHYFVADLARQFDILAWFQTTNALTQIGEPGHGNERKLLKEVVKDIFDKTPSFETKKASNIEIGEPPECKECENTAE
jgi:erythromycin esterase-like protein